MSKNMMLFKCFLRFGLLTSRDDYSLHDYIKAKFCPEYIDDEEFDAKEQLLRDTPGPVGIKYAYYVGNKINGMLGVTVAIAAAFLPIIIITALLVYAYPILFNSGASIVSLPAINGVHAVVAGLVGAHIFRVVYFNKVSRKSLIIVLPAALIFMFLPEIIGGEDANSADFMSFFIAAIIILGIILGVAHAKIAAYTASKPPKFIDPRSRKGKKLIARQLREDEWALLKYRDDDTLEKRKQELEAEAEQKRKEKGEDKLNF